MKVFIVVVKSFEKSAFRKHLIYISSGGANMPRIELYAKRLERKATHVIFLHAAYYTINPQSGNEGSQRPQRKHRRRQKPSPAQK